MIRVVITGVGAYTPVGNSLDEIANSLYSGLSGLRYVEKFNTVHGIVDDTNIELTNIEAAQLDRNSKLAWGAYNNAKADSGNSIPEGVFLGIGFGGGYAVEDCYNAFKNNKKINPQSIIKAMPCQGAAFICMKDKIEGPSITYSTACSSSSVALGEAYEKIKLGKYTQLAVIGSESINTQLNASWWRAIGAVNESDSPSRAVRPFDESRKGTATSEGAVAFIIETLDSALKRNAKIYAEIVGYSVTTGTETFVKPSRKAQLNALKQLLNSIDGKVTYINAHATGTPVGDLVELESILDAFGNDVKDIPVSSTKSLTGHMIGAAGAMETLACLIALKNNKVIPNHFIDKLDSNIDKRLNLPTTPYELEMDIALNNSFAFGGTNAIIGLKKWK